MMGMAPSTHAKRKSIQQEVLHGQDVIRLELPCGDSAVVALHGAQVLSWRTRSGEKLYLSPQSVWDGSAAIRGGVPVCFPQFNMRGPLVKHGFARNLKWQLAATEPVASGLLVMLSLDDSEQTRAWWPHGFSVQLLVHLSQDQLRMSLQVRNTGAEAWSFTGALHTYLQVPDIAQVQLEGLEGIACWDTVRDQRGVQHGPVKFDGEYDSVFASVPGAMVLRDTQGKYALRIENGHNWTNAVVWNPGAKLCAGLTDMPDDGYRHMLCIEAACVEQPVELQPGQIWTGSQNLRDIG